MPSISNFIGRLISFMSMVLMGIGFLMLIKTIKKSSRVRMSSLLLSMVFSLVMLLFNVLVMRSARIQWWFPLLLIFGTGFGFAWGTTTVLDIQEEKIAGKRSILYIYFWLASMVITQLLAFFAKANIVALGLAGMFFSTGASLGSNGNILYRMMRLIAHPQGTPAAGGRDYATKCTHCGAELVIGQIFCSECGMKIERKQGRADEIIDTELQTRPISSNKKRSKPIVFWAFTAIALVVIGAFILIKLGSSNPNFPIQIKFNEKDAALAEPGEMPVADLPEALADPGIVEESPHPTEIPAPPIETPVSELPTEEAQDVTADGETVIFSENFNSGTGNGTPMFSDTYMHYYSAEGLGVIESQSNAGLLPVIFLDQNLKNFNAEFDFMMPEAFEDSQCGFMFRFDTDVSDGLDTFYALLIAPGINKVKMSLWKDNAWNHSQILEPDPALNSGYDINHVRLEVKKDSMEVFINGIFLANFSEGTLKNRGAIGLILYPSASATDGVVDYVLFDNLVITSP